MAKRARRATRAGTVRALGLDGLQDVEAQAARSATDLPFAFGAEGVDLGDPLALTTEGLDQVEAAYRRAHAHLKAKSDIERLMALFLGQVVVAQAKGEWVVYPGRMHVFSPFVVKLPSGKYVQPFLWCADLGQKQLVGSASGTSLSRFLASLEKHATV